MLVSLIITTYNRPNALLLVLRSVEMQSRIPDEVIIADDGSDQSVKKVISEFNKNTKLKIIHCWQADKGFRAAKSRNKAIAKSKNEYIVLIDGDMILHPKFIDDHLHHSKIGFFIQGSRVLVKEKKTKEVIDKMSLNLSFFTLGIHNRKNSIHSYWLSNIFSKNVRHLYGIKTCNMSFFKQDCLEVNGFNNDFEGWGREDSEFAARLINKGLIRKNIRFNALQFHLFHKENPRVSLKKNDLLLEITIGKELTWCSNGINSFL